LTEIFQARFLEEEISILCSQNLAKLSVFFSEGRINGGTAKSDLSAHLYNERGPGTIVAAEARKGKRRGRSFALVSELLGKSPKIVADSRRVRTKLCSLLSGR
jgi:Asp-tRNA(Asn)/Glu-tRNA(Gln) amidotransferase B subunit